MFVAAAVTSFADADAENAHDTENALCLEVQDVDCRRRLYQSLTPGAQCEHCVQDIHCACKTLTATGGCTGL